MAEDSDLERTEPASPRRLEEARERGNVPRSRELLTFAVLFTTAVVVVVQGGAVVTGMERLMRQTLSFDRRVMMQPDFLWNALIQATLDMVQLFMPLLLSLMIAVLVVPVLMGGWLFSMQALQPDFSRTDPFKGIGRIFSVNSLVELGKALAKSLLVGAVGVWMVWHYRAEMLTLANQPLTLGMSHMANLLTWSFLLITASLVLIVALDVPYQLWEYHRKLRMTKEELRQETKENEGDPQIKARVRALQREMARRRMMAEIPKADVIVTNPTHYAVALRYDETAMRAPRVVAKGSYLIAERIRELGIEHHIPLVSAPPLARSLYQYAELEQEIPTALFAAVAEVLAYVYQLRSYNATGGTPPVPPEHLPIPPELQVAAEDG